MQSINKKGSSGYSCRWGWKKKVNVTAGISSCELPWLVHIWGRKGSKGRRDIGCPDVSSDSHDRLALVLPSSIFLGFNLCWWIIRHKVNGRYKNRRTVSSVNFQTITLPTIYWDRNALAPLGVTKGFPLSPPFQQFLTLSVWIHQTSLSSSGSHPATTEVACGCVCVCIVYTVF